MRRVQPVLALAAGLALVIAAVGACGGKTDSDLRATASGGAAGAAGAPKDAGKDAPKDAPKDTKDALPDYEDPGCPDADPPVQSFECDVYASPTGCPDGQACYPYIQYPGGPCMEEVYGTMCISAGNGAQGDPCFQGCKDKFVCVVSGQGNQCAQICDLSEPKPCDDGLICAEVDIPGIGVCI